MTCHFGQVLMKFYASFEVFLELDVWTGLHNGITVEYIFFQFGATYSDKTCICMISTKCRSQWTADLVNVCNLLPIKPWKLFNVVVYEYSKGSDITGSNDWTKLSMPSKEPAYNSYLLQLNINNKWPCTLMDRQILDEWNFKIKPELGPEKVFLEKNSVGQDASQLIFH